MTESAIPGIVPAPIPDAERTSPPDTQPPAAPEAPSTQEPEGRRRRRILFLLLLGLLGLLLLFGAWYLINRKPITEILPPVTVEQLPHYAFSIYGVTAPTGVAVNADGSRIYATQTEGDPQVIAFDGSGTPIASLKPPASVGGDHMPVYVAVNPTDGDVYVSDRQTGQIYIYSADGGYRRTFNPGSKLKGWSPLGLGFDSKGDLFVTSVGGESQAVHEFGPDGSFIRTIGKPGEFNFPNGVAVDAAGNVYVTDSNNGRLIVFDPQGERMAVAKRGAGGGDLALPRGMAIDDKGLAYVADVTVQGVQVFHVLQPGERSPKYVGQMGVEGSTDGAFEYPNAVSVDGRARIYVADWRNNRIQVWSY
jgi:DNA-binding beta-propeller fold protein YncE